MTTAPASVTDSTGHGTPEQTVHLVCLVCYPNPKIGDRALCGHIGTRGPVDIYVADCPVCWDLNEDHNRMHQEEVKE